MNLYNIGKACKMFPENEEFPNQETTRIQECNNHANRPGRPASGDPAQILHTPADRYNSTQYHKKTRTLSISKKHSRIDYNAFLFPDKVKTLCDSQKSFIGHPSAHLRHRVGRAEPKTRKKQFFGPSGAYHPLAYFCCLKMKIVFWGVVSLLRGLGGCLC